MPYLHPGLPPRKGEGAERSATLTGARDVASSRRSGTSNRWRRWGTTTGWAIVAALACLLALAASAQPGEPASPDSETAARAARRELMRQFAEHIVAEIRMRLRNGIDYPPEALANRWEGTVRLAILYPWGGGPERLSVQRSSGHPVLDETALETVRAMSLPPRPDALRGVEFDVTFPIVFRLEVKSGG